MKLITVCETFCTAICLHNIRTVTVLVPSSIVETRIVYQTEYPTWYLIFGLIIMAMCCVMPSIIGVCICYYMYGRKRTNNDQKQGQPNEKMRKAEEMNLKENQANEDEDHISRSGLSAQDSLKLKLGLSDNVSLTPSTIQGPNVIVTRQNSQPSQSSLNIEGLQKKERLKLNKNMSSGDSEAIDENMEHEYDIDINTTIEYGEKYLSSPDNKAMHNILQNDDECEALYPNMHQTQKEPYKNVLSNILV